MEWIKALHVISVIAWMAGMLYLPRLFVYHCDAETGSKQSETFKVMERRLYRGITTPAMVAAYVFGLIMIFYGLVDWGSIWPWVKAQRPAKFYRILNEVPTLLMIVIVIMVIVKPF
jgi:putative membrane protein